MRFESGFIVFGIILCLFTESHGKLKITCGSVIKLQNLNYKVRLHSHDVKYGSGSGQQSVTGSDTQEDVNSHWAIKGPSAKSTCNRGETIKCGDEIRLEHMTTGKNLHSHHFESPLSNSQEVSAFGQLGEGDTGDVWSLVCDENEWTKGLNVMFKHVDTGVYLGASGHTYGRPIHGQMEIVGVTVPDVSTKWRAAEGIYVHSNDFNPEKQKHDEL